MGYANKKDVWNMISVMRPDFTEEQINQNWIDFCEIKVDSILEDYGISTPADDIRSMLKFATILFYFEKAGQTGQIAMQYGDIKSKKTGQVEMGFNTAAPMFFFASGETKAFYGLLAHESWRMEAYALIKAYLKSSFKSRRGKAFQYAMFKADDTLRGYGWDQEKWLNASGQNYNQYDKRKY